MIYAFQCPKCLRVEEVDTKPFHPPKAPLCTWCDIRTSRIYGCHIDTSGCQDVDDIPHADQVAYGGERNISSGQAAKIEAKHQAHNEKTRRQLADGGNRGSVRLKRQIPAALYHGKIKQTGDKNYWDDSKNRRRHKSTEVG